MRKLNALWLERNIFKILVVIILIVSVFFALTSCGARKVSKSKENIEVEKQTESATTDNSKVEIKTDTNTKVIDCTDTDEVEITPIDNTMEMVVNGKTYKNATLKHKKTKANIVTDKKETIAETKQNDVKTTNKENVKAKINKTSKESDRKQFNWVPIIITIAAVILAIVMFVLWYYFGIGKKKKENEIS